MSAAAILERARQLGVEFTVSGNQLRMIGKAPPSPELLTEIAAHKAELLALISARPPLDAEGFPIGTCPNCQGRHFWRFPSFSPRHMAPDWCCSSCAPPPPGSGPCDACSIPMATPAATSPRQ